MKKNSLLRHTLILATIVFSHTLFAQFDGGNGTISNPFLVSTPEQLNNIRNTGKTSNDMKYFKLTSDIDLEGFGEWTPFSESNEQTLNAFFVHIDGNGHVIKNLKCTHRRQYGSLIGVLCGSIRNLGVINAEVDSTLTGGILCGYVGRKSPRNDFERGTVENCFVTGNVKGFRVVGGLTGSIGGKGSASDTSYVKNSYASVNVTCIYDDGQPAASKVGGIVGESFGNVINSYSKGKIISGENCISAIVGGISGARGNSLIRKCVTFASIEAIEESPYVGRVYGHTTLVIPAGLDCWGWEGLSIKQDGRDIVISEDIEIYENNKPIQGITKSTEYLSDPFNYYENLNFDMASESPAWAQELSGKYPQLNWVFLRSDNVQINGLSDNFSSVINPGDLTEPEVLLNNDGTITVRSTSNGSLYVITLDGKTQQQHSLINGDNNISIKNKGFIILQIISQNRIYNKKIVSPL